MAPHEKPGFDIRCQTRSAGNDSTYSPFLFPPHPNQICVWKKQLLEQGADIFDSRKESKKKEDKEDKDALFRTIAHQQVQIDWLKKKLGILGILGIDE